MIFIIILMIPFKFSFYFNACIDHFARERKDIFGRRDVVESFRFHPTLIVLFLKQIEFYYKF